VQQGVIYVQKTHQIKEFKERLCSHLGIEPDDARIWRFENNSWQQLFDVQTKNLVAQLEKMDFTQTQIFPGINLDVITEKRVFESKIKLGGRVCSDKEIVFLE
jgi:hypothetical protein